MTDWTDSNASFGYYSELNPLRLRLAFLNVGLKFPEVGSACELGFGRGMSVNQHAAASTVQWFGTDFNPINLQSAQQFGNNAQLFEQTFIEFCTRTDLPNFDFIALHDVWSWISEQNRVVIVDFLRRKLKVGGVLYISYHNQVAWADILPIRDLLLEHTDVMSAKAQSIAVRFESAVHFAKQLFASNPTITERLNTLAPEYLNPNWQALSFSKTAQLLADAKLNFACSAHYLNHIDSLNLTAEQQALLESITDTSLRETVHDICTKQAVRSDYWLKGAVRLNPLEQTEALRATRIVLVQARDEITLQVVGSLGTSVLYDPIYNPILDVLSDYQVKTLWQIEQTVSASGINFIQMLQAIMVLIGAGIVFPAQEEPISAKAKPQTDELNRYLCHKARGSDDLLYLASPVTGGGIAVARYEQLFILAKDQGYTEPEHWAQFVWSLLAAQNQPVIKNGIAIVDANESLAELLNQARSFADKQLPILIALGICDD
jgi:SAM-dependent methyltransferase